MFISFEGIDGCGKSTQARLLVEGAGERWSAETECLLFTAARRDHLERTIRPALAAGKTVISDRFADSTRVYQGAARGDLRGLVDRMHDLAIGVEPDMTVVIDLDPATALGRGTARGGAEDRFESLGLDFQQRLAQGFRDLADEFPARVRLIDGTGSPDQVAARVRAAL